MTSQWKIYGKPDEKRKNKKYDLDNHFGYLVHGFILQFIGVDRIFFPPDVHNLIWLYIPKRLKFKRFNQNKFQLLQNGYTLIGKESYENVEEEFEQIYTESFNENGMNSGIHDLSIRTTATVIRIGVDSVENKKGGSHYFSPYTKEIDPIFTIRLDCNDWNVCYYSNDRLLYTESIVVDRYFFGMNE